MRLGMVRTVADEPSVAVQRGDDWVALLAAPGADGLGPARTDLLARRPFPHYPQHDVARLVIVPGKIVNVVMR
jgi:hypothetical protein